MLTLFVCIVPLQLIFDDSECNPRSKGPKKSFFLNFFFILLESL